MVTLFHDMMHKEIEVYVDDMIAKSKTLEQHIENLRKLFASLRKYKLRLNPTKCTFGVQIGKLLVFMVNENSIKVDLDKVRAIREMPVPKTESEVKGFLGQVNFIARFRSQLTATCNPIFKLLRKKQKMDWDMECQKAFDKIKQYLENPPVLVPTAPGRPLILYLTMLEESMGCMLGQQDANEKKEQAIYYLSKKFTDCERRYSAFDAVMFHHVPHEENQMADALATLSALVQPQMAYCQCLTREIIESSVKPWYFDIKRYLEKGEYPEGLPENSKRTLRRLASGFLLSEATMCKRNVDMTLLQCVDSQEAEQIMEEAYERIFGTHVNGHALACKILQAGYYWTRMESDCCQHVRKWAKWQTYANYINVAPSALHNLNSPWPFFMWGIDVMDPSSLRRLMDTDSS
ncbi:Retrovirus-related Pol polyprotein from transposon 17.6, partial [Mucuna pruriens]